MIAPRTAAAGILSTSLLILSGSYYFEFVEDLAPCPLCLYERIPHAITIALATMALLPNCRHSWCLYLIAACGLTCTLNAALSFYHVGIELDIFEGLTVCQAPITEGLTLKELKAQVMAARPVSCDEVSWSLFGVSLAGYNMLLSTIVAVASIGFFAIESQKGRKS